MPIRRAYGRKVDSYNPADQRLHVGAEAPVPIPDFWALCAELGGTPAMGTAHMPPVYDQLNTSSCVGNGTAGLFDYVHHKQGFPIAGAEADDPDGEVANVSIVDGIKVLHSFLYPSRLGIYYGAREIEGDTGGDDGAEIRDGVQTVVKQGAGPESIWPFNPARVTNRPSAAYYAAAIKHEALNYTRVSQADYYIGHCLSILGLPIVFGATVFDSFESDAVAKTGMVPMPGVDEEVAGGHCMVIVARDAKRDLYGVRNSWGKDWGIKGYCWIPRAYLLNGALASDFWTLIKLTN